MEDLTPALRRVARGELSMEEAVGPAVGCLMATFGTNMISSCIFDFDDPEELEVRHGARGSGSGRHCTGCMVAVWRLCGGYGGHGTGLLCKASMVEGRVALSMRAVAMPAHTSLHIAPANRR